MPTRRGFAGDALTRRAFLRWSTVTAGAVSGFLGIADGAPGARRRPPNIVLLYADDLGWTDLGCYGSGYYETPNLDRLCREGVKFTDAYSPAANCAPARGCLLSGQYVPRHGLYTVGGKRRFDSNRRLLKWDERKLLAPDNARGLPADKVTFAEVLSQAGYACAHIGKWHLGEGEGQAPEEQGFAGSVPMGSGKTHWRTAEGRPAATPGERASYLSDNLCDGALRFIEDHRERPFMLYYAEYLVHVPLEGKPDLVAKYEAKAPVNGHRNPVYAAMIESLDHSFGRVLAKIDELGLRDNTVVVFFSDNGGCGSNRDRGLDHSGGITSNHPLRGMKGMLYEGGIRVPMIVRWPGVVAPNSTSAEPVHGVDLYPTFLGLAGAEPPSDTPLDGESLVPLLTGQQERLRRPHIVWFMPGYLPGRQAPAQALRAREWKLIENFEDGSLELYNLTEDIGETRNLAATHPEVADELHAAMVAWRREVGARPPPRNPDFDPANEGRW